MGRQEGGYGGSSGRFVKRRGEAETPSAGGCISSFFHLFHFHPFHHFSFQNHPPPSNAHPATTTSTNTRPKGTEAPRNSLESEDNNTMVVGSTISKQHQSLEIPKNNKLFIKTSSKGTISSSCMVNDASPGTKTPTLVARLMGLDLLPPETLQSPSSSSPSSSSTTTTTTTTSSSCLSATKSKQVNPHRFLRSRQQNDVVITKARHSMDDRITASRFLPEAPPISSARRSDVEHRPSLHINKENIMGEHSMELPRFSFSKLKFEDSGFNNSSRSPRQYAKQIVKQMRESVLSSGKVGSDITNTVQNNIREKKKQEGGGEYVVGPFMRSKKSPKTCSSSLSSDELIISSPGKISNNSSNTPSCSPRLRFMNKSSSTMAKDNQPHVVSRVVLANNKPKPYEEAILVQQQQKSSSLPKCNKKAANEKFSPQLKKQDKFVRNNKQHESFVRPLLSSSDKKSKRSSSRRHPLFINLLNTPPATKIPPHQKQAQVCNTREAKHYNTSQLSRGSSQTYKKEATTSLCIQRTTATTPTSGESNMDELDKRKIICGSIMFNNNGPEFEYVSSILSRTDFPVKNGATNNTSSVSVSLFHQWLSPNPQPLDPSIFHLLEQHCYSQNNHNQNNPTCDIFSFPSKDQNFMPYKYDLSVRCNRRLLFDLVNETLLEIVEGSEEKVWEWIIGKIEKGNKKCEFLEDIDALIEMEEDTMKKKKVKSEEEAIIMVAEIEGNIIDTLLHETVMMVTECCFCCCS